METAGTIFGFALLAFMLCGMLWARGRWEDWLYCWEVVNEGGWHTWRVRLLGFEINWQRRRYGG